MSPRRPLGRGRGCRRFPGGGASFVATSIPGITLWLRSTAGVGLTGADVTSWVSQVPGVPNTLVSGTGANPPELIAGALNGKPGIQFVRTGDEALSSTTLPFTGAEYTCAIVYRPDSATNGYAASCGSLTGSNTGMGYGLLAGILRRDATSFGQTTNVDGVATLSQWEVVIVTKASGITPNVYVNGVSQSMTGNGNFTPPAVDARVVAGGVFNNGALDVVGDSNVTIVELDFWSRPLSAAEVTALNAGLRASWGI